MTREHILGVCTAAVLAAGTPAWADATYDSEETRAIVDRMAGAHGGRDAFLALPSVSFTATMYLSSLPVGEGRLPHHNWRHYRVTLDPDTSRAYVDFPFAGTPGPETAVTRDIHWRTDYRMDPAFHDGPAQLSWYHYGMLALPFVAQEDGVTIRRGEDTTLPYHEGKMFVTLHMTYAPEGKTHGGTTDLIIDPDTGILTAWRNGAWYPLLPGDVLPDELPSSPAAIMRVVTEHQDVGGFLLPRYYSSITPAGDAAGFHMIADARLDRPFDEDLLQMPEHADITYQRAAGE